jgi:hypothetical protein
MLKLSDADEQKVMEAVTSPGGFTAQPALTIEGRSEDYGKRLLSGDWGQEDVSIGFQGNISDILPRSLGGARATFSVRVEDVEIQQLAGVRSRIKVNEDLSSCTFGTTSGGALLQEVKLREFKDYPGEAPERILQDVFYRVANVGGYDRGLIDIDAVGTPLLYFVDSDGFKPEESVSDVLSRVLEQVPAYSSRDIAFGGNRTRVVGAIGKGDDVTRTFDGLKMPNWTPPELIFPQYSEVEVYREDANGNDAFRQVAPIYYVGLDSSAIADTPLQIPLNDTSPEGSANAQALANEKALAIGRGLYSGQDLVLPYFYPLIQCFDMFELLDGWRDDDGLWDRAWLLQVDGYKHTYGRGGESSLLSTSIKYTATLTKEDLIDVPAFIMPRVSTNVLVTPGAPVGSSLAEGFWYDPDFAVDPLGEPWIGLDESGAWIDEDLADGAAGHDENGFWFDF